jgi:hypothetical protein
METETRTPDTDDAKCTECCDWIGDYACPNDETLCLFCCPCHVEDLEPIAPITLPTDATRAVARFDPAGVTGYRAHGVPDAPLRGTRREAEADWLGHRLDLAPFNAGGAPLVVCKQCQLPHYDVPGQTIHGPGICVLTAEQVGSGAMACCTSSIGPACQHRTV